MGAEHGPGAAGGGWGGLGEMGEGDRKGTDFQRLDERVPGM